MPQRHSSRSLASSATESRTIDQLTDSEEVLFYRLLSKTDQRGRYHGDPDLLVSYLYPRSRKQTAEFITAALQKLVALESIQWYEVDGRQFVQFIHFERYHSFRKDVARVELYPGPDEADQSRAPEPDDSDTDRPAADDPVRTRSDPDGPVQGRTTLDHGPDPDLDPDERETDAAGEGTAPPRGGQPPDSLSSGDEQETDDLRPIAVRFVEGVRQNHARDPTVRHRSETQLLHETIGVLGRLRAKGWEVDQLRAIVSCATSHRTPKFSWADNIRGPDDLEAKVEKVWIAAQREPPKRPTLGKAPPAPKVCPVCSGQIIGTQGSCAGCGLGVDEWGNEDAEQEARETLERVRSRRSHAAAAG